MVIAHRPKLHKRGVDEGVIKPSLYDISDSAHWANRSDVELTVWREKGLTKIIVRKVRFQPEAGEPGNTWLSYNRVRGSFEEGVDPKDLRGSGVA